MKVAKLSWNLPATRTDGSVLAPADIAKVTVTDSLGTVSDLGADAVAFTSGDFTGKGDVAFSVTVTDNDGLVSPEQVLHLNFPVAPGNAPPSPVSNLSGSVVDA